MRRVQAVEQVSAIHLVVTRPERQGRMIAQFADHRYGLFPDEVEEVVGDGINRVGHGEVLPHHDSVAVADVEERVVLVNVPSPASQEVAFQVDEQRHDLLVAPGIAAVKCVGRHPVGTLHQNRHAVHLEHELAGLFHGGYFRANQLDLADSNGVLARSHHRITLKSSVVTL